MRYNDNSETAYFLLGHPVYIAVTTDLRRDSATVA